MIGINFYKLENMLYLIKSGEYVKIGYTKDLQSRINIYKTHNPIIEIIDVIEGTRIDELYLHQLCEKYLYYGLLSFLLIYALVLLYTSSVPSNDI